MTKFRVIITSFIFSIDANLINLFYFIITLVDVFFFLSRKISSSLAKNCLYLKLETNTDRLNDKNLG